MLEFTLIMYAMAKKVARPARISVKKEDPLRSLGYGISASISHSQGVWESLTCPQPSSLKYFPTKLRATATLKF